MSYLTGDCTTETIPTWEDYADPLGDNKCKVDRSITTTATLIADIGTTYREIHIHGASGAFFVGGSTVTDATGYKIDNGDKIIFQLTPTEKLYGITSSGSSTCGFFLSNR